MFVTQPLNELAKLALIASDAAYFTSSTIVPLGGALAPLRDTPTYDILPLYEIAPGFVKDSNDAQSVNVSNGFKFTAYRNSSTNEVIIAFGGSDGIDPVDWTSNTQLGWNQWEDSRELVFTYLRQFDSDTKIHFTGQSLGGALAQYAAYEWVKKQSTVGDQDFNADFDKTNISLTTFNGLGGLKGLTDHVSYDPTVLQGLGLSGHFYVTNDMVSRFGDGHVGGDTFLLDFRSDRTNDLGYQYAYGLVDAHRIETGFYANLRPGALLEFQVSPGASPIAYLNVDSVQEYAALLGNLLNNKDLGLVESRFRLVAAVTAGLTIGSPNSVNTLTQALLTSLHDSGDLSDSWFQKFGGVNWGAIFIPTRPVTGAISILSTLGAVFTDAVQGAASGVSTIFQAIGEYVSAGSRPDVTVPPPASLDASSRSLQLQFEILMASIGGTPHLAELTASLPSGLDPEVLAAEMLNGGADWLSSTLAFMRDHANSTGHTPTQLAETTTELVTALNHRIDALQEVSPEEKNQLVAQLNAFTQETASGFANALPDFTQKIADVAFNLGKTISDFADVQLIDQAYAAELNDPRLSSSARAAIEDARETFQQAAQTVVIQKGIGPNPFHAPDYVPGGASNATVEERLGEVFRLSLPFAAGTGGQRVSLQLQGSQANHLSVSTSNGVQTLGANGAFELTVAEGDDQLYFSLIANDEVSDDSTVALSAMLVDADGHATHTSQIESTISVKAFVGTGNDGYEPWVEDYSDVTDPTASLLLGVGGFYHQTLRGGAGPDSLNLSAGYGDDTLYGNGGDDWILGGYSHDRLYGGDGNDRLLADPYDYHPDPVAHPKDLPPPTLDGKDYVDGGEGNDRIGGGGNDDRLIGGAGDDEMWGDTLTRGTSIDNPDGSQTFVSLTGVLVPGDDVLEGGDGNDYLSGDGGDDFLDGGQGNDLLIGDTQQGVGLLTPMAPGDDYLVGGDGNDELQGNAGHDVLLGGTGNDRLFGDDTAVDPSQEGDDWLEGGDGNDFLTALGGDDTLVGDDGEDTLLAGAGDDTLLGGEGDDIGFGGEGNDDISAGAGADQFNGEAGNDVMFGDAGDDLLIGGDGLDQLDGGADNDLLIGGADDDTLFGRDGNDELQGNEGNDLLVGDAGDDRIFGQEGNDELFGREGDDALRGDAGDDLIDGGGGDDILVGDADGQIGGSGGNDTLAGGSGNDTLVGGGGQDTYLYELGDGFDIIVEGVGEENRLVFGAGINANTIVAAVGPNDSLVLRTGNGDNAVQIQSFGLSNLNGSHPIDTFEFSDGAVLTYEQLAQTGLAVSGGLGNDQLSGTTQGERIFGGGGNDSINAGAGNDVLFGGAGDDSLVGGSGQDTYMFSLGGGIDQIQDAPGESNRLVFGSGISQTNLSLGFKQVTIPGEGGEEDPGTVLNYLVVRTGATGDEIEIGGFDPSNQSAPVGIDQFVFADGTVLTSSQLLALGLELVGTVGFDALDGQEIYRTIRGLAGNDVLIGGAIDNVLAGDEGRDVLLGHGGIDQLSGGIGDDVLRGGDDNDVLNGGTGNDSLEGEAGDDVLVGGTGDDQLLGGDGSDLYRFNIGDGLDSLFDSGPGTDTDTVQFGSGITSNSISLSSQFGQIVIKVGAGSEGIQSGSVFDVFGSQTIEQFQFEDGTSLTYAELVARGLTIEGTALDDILTGTNLADRLQGGQGNDWLEGGESDDSYFFNVGDGIDTIIDSALVGAGNEVVFGTGITSTDLRLDLASDQSDSKQSDLLIRIGTDGDAIQFDTFDRDNALGPRTVESFRFSDGSALTYEQLLAKGFDLTGTDNDDQIIGTSTVDRIISGDGADVLRSGLGNDTLDGGMGADRLIGGQGDDTYLFGSGAGQDTIVEFQGGLDAIRMVPGVAPSDVAVARSNNDLVLSLSGGADRLTVSLYFLAPPLQIELVQFADGTVWNQAFIENLTKPVITGTEGPDSLIGTSGANRLVGLAGDDQLTGLAGNDLLDGGTGADELTGGFGNDEYIVDDSGDAVTELTDEGIDTVQSSVTRTLEADVENLTLTGSAAINGTGNALDNVLIGNSGANVLTGRAGNDTYVVGADDTVVELTGGGTDTIQTGVSATLGANVENLTLTSSASLIGVGNELDNVLKADGSISVLAGGDGNDTYIIGPNGDDDILIETATGGIDTVIVGHDYRLPANIENLTLLDPRAPDFASFSLIPYGSSEQSVAGYGNDLANTLIGGRANNVLDGGLGADTLIGGDGNDTYVVDNVGDIIIEKTNEGVDGVRSTVSYNLSANVENLTLIGIAPINGTGNALNNDVRGNDASNVLDGGSGNDALFGLGGSDTYLFGRGSGLDTLFDSEAAGEVDTIQFDSTVTAEDVEVYRNGFNLELAISGTTDELTLLSFFDSPEYGQKQARFSDGTVWSSAELNARALIGNTITGSSDSEVLSGGAGHDLLTGSAGNDVLMGGAGKDVLYGDLTFQPLSGPQVIGDDTLIGGGGNDNLIDFRGNNLFDGGAGDDTLSLGTGVDRVLFYRGSGVDYVTLDNNRNDIDLIEMAAEITPAEVVMTWRSPSSADILILDSGDRLTVQLSTDWFAVGPETTQAIVRFADGTQWNLAWSASNVGIPMATSSNDVLEASFPASLVGLDGDDIYLLGSSGVPGNYAVVEAPGEGIDTVQSLFDYVLDSDVENLILAESRSSVLRNPERGIGNGLDNLIIGNSGDNILDGGAGNDVLVGGFFRSAEEFVVFETGSDILIGGEGDDVLMADGGNIVFPVDGSDSEWLFLGGGSEFRSNVPRLADDLLIGGVGNDTYIVHSQEQTVAESENEGTDTVKSTVSYILGAYLENLELISPPAIFDEEDHLIPPPPLNGTGNELDNVLIGSEDANVLSGLTGRDTLVGRLGSDRLLGGAGYDTYLFNLGDGIDAIEDVATAGEGNRIQFGAGIGRNDLTVMHDEIARTLTIQVGTSGTDRLVLNNFDLTGADGSLVVETLAFADGSTASITSFFGPTITEGNDTITTAAGDDVIDALGGNDLVDAGAGNDIIAGGTGNDTLMGGPGDDTYVYDIGDGVDTINDASLPSGTNTLEFGAGINPSDLSLDVGSLLIHIGTSGDALHLSSFDPNNVLGPRTIETFRFADGTALSYEELVQRGFDLTGTDGNDSITGTNVVDRITALAGDDMLAGGRGNDLLTGGIGNDTYIFNIGDGSDTIDDTVLLGAGNRIQFGPGISQNDLIFTQDEAAHTLTIRIGTDGIDRLVLSDFDPRGTNGSLVVSALEFADGNVVNLIDLYPPNHAPTVAVPTADQTAAEDSFFTFTIPATTFTDADVSHGDALVYIAALADGSPLPAWLGFDPLTRTFSGTPGVGDAGVLQLAVTATDQGHLSATDFFTLSISGPLPQTLVGTLENDVLTGGRGDDTLRGLAGNDQLSGAEGHDLLDGGSSTDTMEGGAGDDIYIVDVAGDIVTELVDEGADTVQTSLLTYTLGVNVENLILTGTGPSTGIGNALSNQLAGNSGANLLDGKTGTDMMAGGMGNDVYVVDQTGDVVIEAANEGSDTVFSSVTYGLGVNVEHLVLTGSAAINGTGNDLNNTLTGNNAANVLMGLSGNDMYVISAGDTVVESANDGTDTVVSSLTYILAANVENLTLVGFNAISGTGNGLDNVLNGLLNFAGNTLSGGAGNDTYIMGAGDTVVEIAGGGIDTIQTSMSYTLGANVENLTLTGIGAVNGTGNGLNNTLTGNSTNNVLSGAGGNDMFRGSMGNDTLIGGSGNDTYLFDRGDGQDFVRDNSGTADKLLYDSGIDPLDLVISRQANDLRLAIHGSVDSVTIQNWYTSSLNRTEMIEAGNGQTLLNTQVDQLIQAMAAFTQQTGLTWDQAIDQRPQDVQTVLAASWQ
ncbi:MAG: Alkaline phosphatase [Nitrospira sp.]|nr:MAG: Alkaline phosphatase [Nitrospira sp.]